MSQSMNGSILGALLGYVALQFVIGAWVSRRITSDRDYIIAGRSLGATLVAFSVFATWFGAEAIQVSAGEIYEKGLSGALVDPFGYGIAVVVVGLFLAAPLWRRDIVTFADMIRDRYSPEVEKLFVLILLPGSLFWAAAQIRAFGQILSASGGLELTTAILIAAIVVGLYSVVGGLLADAVTDVIQGLVVIIGLITLTYVIMTTVGFEKSLETATVERLDPFVAGDDGMLAKLEKLAITICGSIVSVELISRLLGAKSAAVARNGTLAGGLLYLAMGLIPIYLGLAGPGLVKDLKETEQLVPKLAEAFLPRPGLCAVFGSTRLGDLVGRPCSAPCAGCSTLT